MMRLDEATSLLSNLGVYRSLVGPGALARGVRSVVGRGRHGHAPPPFITCWLATLACNGGCAFCNVKGFLGHGEESLSAAYMEGFARRFSIFAIGGGEPFARPDMLDVLRGLKRAGTRTMVATNGTLLTPDRAGELARIGTEIVMFSLLGGAAFHDASVGLNGAWDRACSGIEALVRARRGTRVVINCVVGDNAAELRAVAEAGKRLGVDAVRYTLVSFMTAREQEHSRAEGIRAGTHVCQDPPATNTEWIAAEMRTLKGEFGRLVSFHPRVSHAELDSWFREGGGVARRCSFVWHSLFLKPDGTVVPCGHMLDHPVGNVREQPLEAIWNGEAMRSLRMRLAQGPLAVCARCCKT